MEDEQPFEIILIGDTGNVATREPDPVFELLKKQLPSNPASAVIFLGDNVYPRGLPARGHELRKEAENTLHEHFEAIKDFGGRVIFISGNHDWNKGRSNGYEYVLRQEEYIKEHLGDKQVFIPPAGCPGPEEIALNEHLTLIAINTQWWLQGGFRPIGIQSGCNVETEEEFFIRLEELLAKNHGKQVLVIGHYPVYSYSVHGGKYKWKHHLFPFTLYHKKAYVPLPVAGSLLPLYRKFIGAREDLSHPRYRRLRSRLKDLFRKHGGIIYASGHDHNLQHISKYGNHFIISGSASKIKYVTTGKHARFTLARKGFFKLQFETGQRVRFQAWTIDKKHPEGGLVYTETISLKI